MRFEIYCKGFLIGHSELESGDPPMGVALGRFVPNAAYEAVRPDVLRSPQDQASLQLTVRFEGKNMPCVGITITDYSKDLSPDGIEISVLGIPYPLYAEVFPDHVAAYDKKFKGK